MKKRNPFLFLFVVVGLHMLQAQKKDENIGSEVVNVVKPYTASISDAFKVKEVPTLDDEETTKKENITYAIFSFPVASTFTPSKGKAAVVDKSAKEKLFANYATLAAGNYGTVNAALYLTHLFESNSYIATSLRHFSSQGGIKNLLLEDQFYNTALELTYGKKDKQLSYQIDFGYQSQVYNWYGFQSVVMPLTSSGTFIDDINEKQKYNTLYLGGSLAFNEGVMNNMEVQFNHFTDAFASSENQLSLKPSFGFDFLNEKIKTNVIIDYVKGNFQKDYYDVSAINYGFTNIGFNPSFAIHDKELSVNLGATFFYSMSNGSGTNKFFMYPSITASLKVVGDLMIAFAGAEGSLKQNTYRELVDANNFLSPTLNIAPTDARYDVYAGLKGKLANSVSYTVKASYLNEGNKALFASNTFNSFNANTEGYTFGNSFGLVYDDVKTVSLFGELKADFSQNVAFSINGTLAKYTTKNEQSAWNLPAMKLSSNLRYTISPKWETGVNVFYVGQRKDREQYSFDGLIFMNDEVQLPGYVDLNAHVNYKHSDRLTFFLKGNNLASQNYQKWLGFPVQGIQVLLGANFKFDF